MRPCLLKTRTRSMRCVVADRFDLPAEALAPVLEHVVLGAALDRLAEQVGAAGELGDHLAAVRCAG